MNFFDHGGDVYGYQTPIRLDFSVNLNPLGIPPSVSIAAQTADFARYPDPHCRELCRGLALHHGVCPEDILCGNGAADLIIRLLLATKPKKILVTAPTFSEYEKAAQLAGAVVVAHPLGAAEGFALTPHILEAITPDINLVFLCSPNNPTGALADFSLLQAVAKRCDAVGARLAVDECFLDFTHGPSVLSLLEEYPRLVVVKAFTKMYSMAGLRLGYLVCKDRPLLQAVAQFGQSWSVSSPAQAAGAAALALTGWAETTRRLVDAQRAVVTGALLALGLTVYPGSANFLLLRSDTIPLAAPLLAQGILIRSCGNYRGLDDRYYRIGLKTEAENQELLLAIAQL